MLPVAFRQSMEELLGAAAPQFFAALEDAPTTSVRLHPTKGHGLFPEGALLPWSVLGRKLPVRPSFTFDPLFHAGSYYVQDGSSQFVEAALGQVVDLSEPLIVLDACAAPGGKTTHLQALLGPGSVVIGNEVIGSRAKILQENLWKWGMPEVLVTSADPKVLGRAELQVDVLVVDAPCSGEGLFRKDPDAMKEWSPAHVAHCASRQKRILADLWSLLKPGGLLLYSTCTWNTVENEGVLAWAITTLGAEQVSLEGAPHIRDGVCRFFPQDDAGEGFTCGALRKVGGETLGKTKHPAVKEFLEARSLLQKYIAGSEDYIPVALGDTSYALPKHLQKTFDALLTAKISVLSAGVPLAEVFGSKKECKPHPMLTHSTAFQGEGVALSEEEAITYLRRQDVPAQNTSEGRVVVTYEGRNLGWGRVKAGRLSSLYPMHYRIRR